MLKISRNNLDEILGLLNERLALVFPEKKWSCEQDTSEGFFGLLHSMLNQLGFGNVARKI
jgi:hypothetical protein